MTDMIPRERAAFSAIEDRPKLALPDGARMILWPLISLEDWDIGRAMARTVIPPPQHQPLLPDVPNWSWHEYGMRVGFWRIKKVFDRHERADRVNHGEILPRTGHPVILRGVHASGCSLRYQSRICSPVQTSTPDCPAMCSSVSATYRMRCGEPLI